MDPISRRGALSAGLASGLLAGIVHGQGGQTPATGAAGQSTGPAGVNDPFYKPGIDPPSNRVAKLPIAISSYNGLRAVAKAVELMKQGIDPLDSGIAGVNINEDDPEDDSVGLGGLPNEEGVVELDSSVMHGPSRRGGAVAGLRSIRNPSKVAKLVMNRTDHCLLVGEGALRFALAHGFKPENLLTEKSRLAWLKWKETLSEEDDWLPEEVPGKQVAQLPNVDDTHLSPNQIRHIRKRSERITGTIHLSALDLKGNLGGVTSTSGLSYKIPGRIGDSPIFGAGLYTDNDVGSAGSTGRGEANLLGCSSFLIVEQMRMGKTPEEACLEAVKRIVDHTIEPRLRHKNGRPNYEVKFYAIDKKGRFGSASIYKGATFTFADANGAYTYNSAYLYEKKE